MNVLFVANFTPWDPLYCFLQFFSRFIKQFFNFFHPSHENEGCLSWILNRTKVLHIDLVWQIYHYPKVNTFFETICYNSYREYNHIYQEPLSINHTFCRNSSILRPEQWRWCQTLQILQSILSSFFTSELHLQHFVLSAPIITTVACETVIKCRFIWNVRYLKTSSILWNGIMLKILKACVCYFLSNFYFSLTDRPSKTMKNAFYFI